ncbi:unnamed protein product [Scytosiphon promiscuus]
MDVDTPVLSQIAGSTDTAHDAELQQEMMLADPRGQGDGDVVQGSERVRKQPIDTRIRLHFKQTQASTHDGILTRSMANFGNTHIMASQPGPVNMSIAKLVESGMTFVEARKMIARATREAHHQFVREGEQQLAKEMSFRDVNERAKNAHTLGTATITNKIERMHRRGREQQARAMLRWNEEEHIQHKQQKQTPRAGGIAAHPHRNGQKGVKISSSGDIGSMEIETSSTATTGRYLAQASTASSSLQQLSGALLISSGAASPEGDPAVAPRNRPRLRDGGINEKQEGQRVKSGRRNAGDLANDGSESERGEDGDVREEDSLEKTGGRLRTGQSRESNDVAFVLRKLYTGGGLDAQQQAWQCMPTNLFNTLTLQLGTLSKINMPRNSLQLLISLRNPNFSCAHMRSVEEINLSGNKLQELPEDAQRFTSLSTLRLDNNKLSGLPEGLLTLTSLTRLSLRHNNFSNLPYRFGDLHRLQRLDLGENMLKTLPPTMGLLTSLKHLKLDGNNMPHLAMPPPLKTSSGKDQSACWVKRWHRDKKREMWMNDGTGEISDADPTSASVDRSTNAASASTLSGLNVGTFEYNRRRNDLAIRGIYEWEAALNVSTGKVYYMNNVNYSKVQTMPACMNRLGEMGQLVSLKLSQNKLRSLPSSICLCRNLEVLEANDNYLEKLPAKLGEMKRLKNLRLDVNCLSELPPSMVQLERLEELCLTSNFFATFPEFAMKMSGLKKLLLGNNQLKKLPYSIGFLTSLQTLQLYNNPLADPPAELLLLGMGAMLWECRRRHWVQVRGPPPAVKVHGFGIEEEKLELQPEFNRKLAKCIQTAGKTGELNFMMEGLTHFPMGVFQEEIGRKLKGLRLDSNDFSDVTIAFRHTWQDLDKVTHSVSLCNLTVLSLKSCKLRQLGEDMAELGCLRELYLESNYILALPETFIRLRALEVLNMQKNRLQDCPDGIGSLSRLKHLELDGNRLEVLPPSLSQLTQLEVLTLSSNHVYQLPDEIVGLEKLKTLDANGNMLTHLPPGFGNLRLRSLKLSYNRLETLRHEVFRPVLKGTLKQLWLSNNNLLQLPDSLVELSKVQEVLMDSNPYKSPPPELLAEGIATVMLYVKIRMKRIDVMHNLILDRGFDTCLDALVPQSCGVLMSNTGYLGPPDLDEFDKAVDRFINGDYYRHPLTAEAILDVAKELRATRKKEFYERLVEHLMAQILIEETREVFSDNVFSRHTTRPWGRRGGPVGCLAIALSALFEDTPKNAFVEEFRPAMWTEAKKTLPRSVFEYSQKALRKALVTLRSAYGPIAIFEDINFEFCECVDADTGEEIRHPKGQCLVPGMVIVKIIYTQEEASRRKEEDKEVFEAFEKTNKQLRGWLKTKQGMGRVMEEIKKRKAIHSCRISMIDMSVATLKGVAVLKQELLVFAQQRKRQFEDGEPFHFHSLNSIEEASALVEAAEKEVTDIRDQTIALEQEKGQLKEKLKERVPDVAAHVEDSLVDKYCHAEYTAVLKRNRTMALKQGWRRPWDGMDGEDFRKWAKKMKCVAADRHERPENVGLYKSMSVPVDDRDWDETPSDLAARINWKGTDNMTTFLVPTLLEWKAEVASRQDPDALAKEAEGGDEDGDSRRDGTTENEASGDTSDSEDGEGSSGGVNVGAEAKSAGDAEGAAGANRK